MCIYIYTYTYVYIYIFTHELKNPLVNVKRLKTLHKIRAPLLYKSILTIYQFFKKNIQPVEYLIYIIGPPRPAAIPTKYTHLHIKKSIRGIEPAPG